MKKIYYEIKETKIDLNEETVTSYGISCKEDGIVISSIDDISTDRDSVGRLAGLCNELELDPLQLEEVAEDFVS
ncbi:MAG: hypothetical protein J5528_03000 [Firmicutes bacterium]|nr:hypothetical protein [Bacillota bacterium]